MENLIQKQHYNVTPVEKRHPRLRSGTGVQVKSERLDSHLRGNDREKHSTNGTTSIIDFFHQPPLYSTNYSQNFGTVYTAVYKPQSGSLSYHWPDQDWPHSFEQFNQDQIMIQLGQSIKPSSEWQTTDNYSNDIITHHIKSIFDNIFDHLPESAIINQSAFNQLKQKLNSNQVFNWQQLNSSMQEIWQ